MIILAPFWEMLKKRKISTYDLEYKYELNPSEISRLKHNHNFTLKKIDDYCKIFKCEIQDIIVYIDDDKKWES